MRALVILESMLLALLMTIPPLVVLITLYLQRSMTLFNLLAWVLMAFIWTIVIAVAYSKRWIKLLLK
ncbi:MAG TPA: hypothetical protein EYH45_06240 [Candidatus Caldiarchaeum subterraneum]|uniref:Uncharacterized protein n=1 Tax=Caldiarchaeum subterraneum TaxID=311458 RepID=A0A832ZWH2_CALS0|nr:hypothetical protein [Aigarchaeota archaeon]HIQ30145.1 hypothetical protein [Candidatus Caldarchaeum subterraneum]